MTINGRREKSINVSLNYNFVAGICMTDTLGTPKGAEKGEEFDLHSLEKPKNKIETLKGTDVAEDLRDFAKRQGIDLSLADMQKTKAILKDLPSSLSDEIIKTREAND